MIKKKNKLYIIRIVIYVVILVVGSFIVSDYAKKSASKAFDNEQIEDLKTISNELTKLHPDIIFDNISRKGQFITLTFTLKNIEDPYRKRDKVSEKAVSTLSLFCAQETPKYLIFTQDTYLLFIFNTLTNKDVYRFVADHGTCKRYGNKN